MFKNTFVFAPTARHELNRRGRGKGNVAERLIKLAKRPEGLYDRAAVSAIVQ